MKKSVIFLVCLLLLSSLVLAQNKLEISTLKDKYSPNENITLRASLYDSGNFPVSNQVLVSLTDPQKLRKVEKTIQSNEIAEISIGENPPSGTWTINASYQDKNTGEQSSKIALFFIDLNELAKFELQGDNLTITNIGNARYAKTVNIIIGDSVGTRQVDLFIGESISFRLIAPPGNYNIKITDGATTISKDNVILTGEVVGFLEEDSDDLGSSITGTIGKKSVLKSSFIYIFVLIIFTIGILLAVERHYRRKLGK